VVSVGKISRRWTGGLSEFFFSPAAGGLAKSSAAKPKFFLGRRLIRRLTGVREALHGKNQIAHVAVKERMDLKLFGREIIFEEFQLM